ncbi:MAG TPA: NYN domain-containing protein [Bacillales bacterium]|nr:NYN domain-containing protein [Bacillales bacterium]
MDILLVDGYNMIGAWPELQQLKDADFAAARDLLIEKMEEYQSYTGYQVIVVFDAHSACGWTRQPKGSAVDVIFTKKNETADERIEKLAIHLNNVRTQIHVATSDATEQWAIFGQGALRKSARELLIEVRQIEQSIAAKVREESEKKPSRKLAISDEMAELFEKWRREGK